MSQCRVEATQWKQRRALRLSNGTIEITVLTGGGHIADFRLYGSPVNALWEAPWLTIEPKQFSRAQHTSVYGEEVIGRMLASYTGHALALGYFGMPSKIDAERGLTLHGEAAITDWRLEDTHITAEYTSLSLAVDLPVSELSFRRTLTIAADKHVVEIEEVVKNLRLASRQIQWVEHAAFGEPLLTRGESSVALSGDRGMTWPLGYEGRGMLPDNREFSWPHIDDHDLSQPFSQEETGFVATVRATPRADAFAAVHNHRLALSAGYIFNSKHFPWLALWEENCAREYPPWNGSTKVRGLEFGTTPMPLGLEYAQKMQTLFDTPTLREMGPNEEVRANYSMFITSVPATWQRLEDISREGNRIALRSDEGEKLWL